RRWVNARRGPHEWSSSDHCREVWIRGDLNFVLRCSWDGLPREDEWVGRIVERPAVDRREELRGDPPALANRPYGPAGYLPALGDGPAAPPVAAIRRHLANRGARVTRGERPVTTQHRRVEVRVCGQLKLVVVGAPDRGPGERRQHPNSRYGRLEEVWPRDGGAVRA